jgi:thiamine-phosphate pyrophosphorylase
MTDERMGTALWQAIAALPPGGGIVFRHYGLDFTARRALFARLLRIARRRGLVLIYAGPAGPGHGADGRHNRYGTGLLTASVHDVRQALAARRRGVDLVFVSPVFETVSHPGSRALGPLRAAAIARATGLPAIALGGMDERRFARLRGLGFHGWAGIDAWTVPGTSRQKRNAVPI